MTRFVQTIVTLLLLALVAYWFLRSELPAKWLWQWRELTSGGR